MQTESGNRQDTKPKLSQIRDNFITLGYLNAQEGKNTMDQNINQNPVAPEVPATLTPEEVAKLMDEMANKPITTDEAEPTDAERVVH